MQPCLAKYGELFGKIHAKASLVSAAMILLLPLLASVSLVLPIKVFLIFDLIGIIIAFSLFSPKIKYGAEDEEGEKIWSQLKKFKGTGFYITSLFPSSKASAIRFNCFIIPIASSLSIFNHLFSLCKYACPVFES